jgi:5-methylcytosine-specific restriction protein A
MLQDVLEKIGAEYAEAKTGPSTSHPLARYIRVGGPSEIARVVGDSSLEFYGGCGVSGNWAHVPWVGLFDPVITDSAQRGFYIVYLFSADMQRVYLSLNQGTTEIQGELGSGRETFDELRSRAAIMRERVSDNRDRLDSKAIDLASNQFYPRGYEAGHAIGMM